MKLTEKQVEFIGDLFGFLLTTAILVAMWAFNPIIAYTAIFCAICMILYVKGFGRTELGPFSELRSGGRLDRKVAKDTIVGYYLNEPGYGIDQDGNIYEDRENKYLKNLRKNFFFRFFGLVYTSIPYAPFPGLGGVVGSWVQESKVKVSKNSVTGVIEPTRELLPPVYYMSPPIFIKQGLVLSGIPIEGGNLVEFAFSYTLRVTNVHQFQYRVGDPTELVGDNFESMLRPKVATMQFEDVQKMSSEVGQGQQSTTLGGIRRLVDQALQDHGYGCVIHEINTPIIQPTGPYAEAVRKKELNEALRLADEPAVDQDVNRINKVGMAEAQVRKALVDASRGNMGIHIEEGMKNLRSGATFVLGQGVIPSLPISGGSDNTKQKEEGK